MKKKIITVLLLFCMALSLPASAAAKGYSDVPPDSWAEAYIARAGQLGIMSGYDDGRFGYGEQVTRAQFAAMLVRLFAWERVAPDVPTFSDNSDKSVWYYAEIETAVKNGAVPEGGGSFRPNDAITREEMAVMLVRGLGYDTLAGTLKSTELPFQDVTKNWAYIKIAYDFGIITGTSVTEFNPDAGATREQAAAMMVWLSEAYRAKLGWAHAFYAISSYGQKDLIPEFDALSFGWSRLECDALGEPVLNLTSSNSNPYSVPQGYQEVLAQANGAGVKTNLSVYMSASRKVTLPDGTITDACSAILTDPARRARAAEQIAAALGQGGGYTGVTVDFEEMKGAALKDGLNMFLLELKSRIAVMGASLYVCVHPVTSDGVYYDAYDYKTIGTIADKVILMAHDYGARTLTPSEMSAGFTATPTTPIYEIYTALQAITDSDTGVGDKSRIALAVSFGSIQWKKIGGAVVNAAAYTPGPRPFTTGLSIRRPR